MYSSTKGIAGELFTKILVVIIIIYFFLRSRECLNNILLCAEEDCSALRYICELVSRRAGFMASAGEWVIRASVGAWVI